MRPSGPRKLRRRKAVQNDGADALNNTYSEQAGSLRTSNVGHKLYPISDASTHLASTDASSAKKIGLGCSVAIYNPTGTAGVVTFGGSTVALLAAGAVDTGDNRWVGIPLKANDWTYLNSFDHDWIITTSGMFTFIIGDDLYASEQN